MLPLLRTATFAGVLAMASLVHAATPIALPLGRLGGPIADDVELPVPPPPRVARPDVSRFPLVIKPSTRACGEEERRTTSRRADPFSVEGRRAPTTDGWAAAPVRTSAPVRKPVSSRLG